MFVSFTQMFFKSDISTDGAELIDTVVVVVFVFAWLFIYCECGDRLTNKFNWFHEKLCQCRWYKFKLEMQQSYSIALSCTQESVVIEGFLNVVCTREAFKRVNTAFMIWHQH